MSKHEKLIQAVDIAVESLERASVNFERLASMMPRDFDGSDLTLMEVALIRDIIGRLQQAHGRLSTAQIILSARLGAKT